MNNFQKHHIVADKNSVKEFTRISYNITFNFIRKSDINGNRKKTDRTGKLTPRDKKKTCS